jgi:hypothetical protein
VQKKIIFFRAKIRREKHKYICHMSKTKCWSQVKISECTEKKINFLIWYEKKGDKKQK